MDLELESPYLVKRVPGFTPVIGHLVSMMRYTRTSTLDDTDDLTSEQLDYLLDENANSIGMLLEHIASVEEYYQRETFGLPVAGEHLDRWRIGANLGAEARRRIRGHDLDHYLQRLAEVRDRSLQELARREDDWLFEETPYGGRVANNYFKWFHVVEDEIGHAAQIRLLRKRLPDRYPS